MPSPRHDTVNQLFRDRPALAVEILHDLLDVDIPTGALVRLESNDFNDRPSRDFQPDTVISVGPPQRPTHGVIVEAQHTKLQSKRRQLPRYAAALWLMLDCQVTVLCICPDNEVAAFYAEPIPTKVPGYTLETVVLGPDRVPLINEPAQAAKQPELATLSVMMHGRNRLVIESFIGGLALMESDHAPQYYEYAFKLAEPRAQRLLEEIMSSTTWPVYSPFAREHHGRGKKEGREEGLVEGRFQGEADAILKILKARNIVVPDDARTRIAECQDGAQLDEWLNRTLMATSVDDLFDVDVRP